MSTKPFHKVRADWFDLEQGWNNYQHEGRMIRRCIILTCEATGMVLTYFMTCAKEDENLPILKYAANYLHLRYNLQVKVVRSDNEMNRNQTKKWFAKKGLILNSALQIHMSRMGC
jgi:hypothetical protein